VRCRLRPWGIVLALLVAAPSVRALDKQGSGAHGGAVEGLDWGVDVSGAASVGLAFYNPTYAARPDNSGHALMRYALHSDVNIIGRRLSFPLDLNLFSDRDARGAGRKFVPSEIDVIAGITSTWGVGSGALELSSRVEADHPLDRGGYSNASAGAGAAQTYVDVRARYLYSFAKSFSSVGPALANVDLSGWLTLGWFVFNPGAPGTYFARPNNTGSALFRYAWHAELSVYDDVVSFAVDTTFFTDRGTHGSVGPTELDLTPEIIVRHLPWELHLAYERDMPLDSSQPFLAQHFAYLLAVYNFDLLGAPPSVHEKREHVPSP
jgi:hypothetical protein